MRHLKISSFSFYLFSFIFLVTSCHLPTGSPSDPRVILISIDGLRAEIFLEPEKHGFIPGELKNFERLKEIGTYVREVTTVFPSLTYPAHTSMVTGVTPDIHKITHNQVFDTTGHFLKWYWYSDSISVSSIFTLAKEKRLITAGISWSVSVNGPFDFSIPEIISIREDESTLNVVRRYDRPWWFLEYFVLSGRLKVGKEATEGFERDRNLHLMFKYLFKKHLPHLTAYHIIETDEVQHRSGKDSADAHSAYLFADSLVGAVMKLISDLNQWEQTTLIVTGDHGFVDYHTLININALFVEEGLIHVDERGEITNWDALCQAGGGSAFIRLRNPADKSVRLRVEQLLSNREEWVLLKPSELTGELKGYTRADFALIADPGYSFTRHWGAPFTRKMSGGTHGGDPRDPQLKTTLFAAGRAINKRAVLDEMHITQVAAIVAELLSLPEKFEAVCPTGLINL